MPYWPDTSEHNGVPLDPASYRRRWFAFRANDGTYRDRLFRDNYLRAEALRSLIGYMIYTVWPRSSGSCRWQDAYHVLTDMIGHVHRPRLVIMMDVETWGRGDLHRDFSPELEAMRRALVKWLNSLRPAWQRKPLFGAWYRAMDSRRVIGYGNRGDLQAMARDVNWPSIVLADYSSNPTPAIIGHWRVIARQYRSDGQEAPWTRVDMNRATLGHLRLARALGIGRLRWTLR